MCAVGAKAMVGKTAGALAGIKAVAPNCANSHCILHHRTLAVKKNEGSRVMVRSQDGRAIYKHQLNFYILYAICSHSIYKQRKIQKSI